jgi:hypothetical protein
MARPINRLTIRLKYSEILRESKIPPVITLLRLLVGCHGDKDVGLGFEFREHEILYQVLTGLARARDFLIEEVSGPHSFGINNLIY